MVVKSSKQESGQSVIEFLLLLPLIVGMVVSLVKANTAVQASIVNQQYARQHALFLAYNSPVFPELKNRLPGGTIEKSQANQMVILVGEESYDDPAARDNGGGLRPHAPTQSLTKKPNQPGNAEPPAGRPGRRSQVRIYTGVSICTQPSFIRVGDSIGPATNLANAADPNVDFRHCAYDYIERGVR